MITQNHENCVSLYLRSIFDFEWWYQGIIRITVLFATSYLNSFDLISTPILMMMMMFTEVEFHHMGYQ
jgi:hypothetical protein